MSEKNPSQRVSPSPADRSQEILRAASGEVERRQEDTKALVKAALQQKLKEERDIYEKHMPALQAIASRLDKAITVKQLRTAFLGNESELEEEGIDKATPILMIRRSEASDTIRVLIVSPEEMTSIQALRGLDKKRWDNFPKHGKHKNAYESGWYLVNGEETGKGFRAETRYFNGTQAEFDYAVTVNGGTDGVYQYGEIISQFTTIGDLLKK